MNGQLATVLAAAIGAVAGGSGGLLAIWWQVRLARIERKLEHEKEERQLRLLYVHPFRSATIEFEERMTALEHKYADPKEKDELLKSIGKIRDDKLLRHSPEFFRECNGGNGVFAFAMSTLHITARFLAHAVRTRTDTPFRDIHRSFSDMLTQALFDVRKQLNDDGWGIYEQLQDNIGYKMLEGASVKTYEQFCRSLANDDDFPWYLRMIDYYLDIENRRRNNIPKVRDALLRLKKILQDYENVDSRHPGIG
jgi:hypothetical protein